MRRVIRHIVTLVTFERWSINWEKSSTVDSLSQDMARKEMFTKEEPNASEQRRETQDLSIDKASEKKPRRMKLEEIRNVWQLII
jgi:hypothetical protein